MKAHVWGGKVCRAVAALVAAVAIEVQADINTWSGSGYWTNAGSWSLGHVPTNGEDVVVNGMVTSTVSSAALGSYTLNAGKTNTFDGWDLVLTATVVTVNGTITHTPNTDTNKSDGWQPNSRVYIACSNLTVSPAGMINVDFMGYRGGTSVATNGYGPGGATAACGGGSCGGYGGAGWNATKGYGAIYGTAETPSDPGSGGGFGSSGSSLGGAGGGAVRISATGCVTINGTITANGAKCNGTYYGGGGSGGGIYIECDTIAGSTGTVSATGGAGSGTSGYDGGGGSGGRIAVHYSTADQPGAPDIVFLAVGGYGALGRDQGSGDLGTLWFPDSRLLSGLWRHSGQLIVPGWTNWGPASLFVSNVWVRFPDNGFLLSVTNDVVVAGGSGRLDLGGNHLWPYLGNSQRPFWSRWSETSGPTLTCANLYVTNGGQLYVFAGITNSPTPDYGALVDVAGKIVISSNSWICPAAHPTNGAAPLFRMNSLLIPNTNSGFNANGLGYWGGTNGLMAGFGPGGGIGTNSSKRIGGGGYGGRGGNYTNNCGLAYGSANAPLLPGSGGGAYTLSPNYFSGKTGGGLIRIIARKDILFNGTMTANGGATVGTYCGGGSGGGIYLQAKTFTGTTNALLSANGSSSADPVTYGGGGGGGGRIAVWRSYDHTPTSTAVTTNVFGGAGIYQTGEVGTVVFDWLKGAGTVMEIR